MNPCFLNSESPFSISSIEYRPPNILYTYSGVTQPKSIEHERASSSRNCLSLCIKFISSIRQIFFFGPIATELTNCFEESLYLHHFTAKSTVFPLLPTATLLPFPKHKSLSHQVSSAAPTPTPAPANTSYQ